jgi:WD40 repeat protein
LYLYQTAEPYVLAFFPGADQGSLSQDEKLLAIGLKNGDVQIWNMDDMSLKQTFTHRFPEDIVQKIEEDQLIPYYVGGITFSPDNSEIAVGYADGTIDLFRIGENKPHTTLRHDSFSLWQTDIGLIFQLSYSPDGKTLVVFKYAPYINANRLTFWSLPDGNLISVSEAGRFYQFASPAYLPDGQTLLVSSRKDSYLYLTLWNVQAGKKLNGFATGLVEIISTDIAPDGKQVTIYGSDAQQIYYRRVWTMPEGTLLENEKLDEYPGKEYYTRIDKLLFEQGHYYNTWSDETNRNFAQLGVTGNQTFRILGESSWLNFPEETSEPLNLPEEASDPYYDRHEQTIGWCTPGALHFMDKDGKVITAEVPLITHCNGLIVSPARSYAVAWYGGQSMYLVNLKTGKFNKLSSPRGWTMSILTAQFSPDEEILISSRPGLVTIWQVDPAEKIVDSQPGIYTGNNIEAVFSKDGTFAVTLNAGTREESDESQLVVWRIQDAFTLHRINPPLFGDSRPEFTTFALSPSNELIASGDDFGGIGIWSVKSGEELAYFDIDALPLDLAFTPDGSGLIMVLGDGTVRLWGVP